MFKVLVEFPNVAHCADVRVHATVLQCGIRNHAFPSRTLLANQPCWSRSSLLICAHTYFCRMLELHDQQVTNRSMSNIKQVHNLPGSEEIPRR